MYSDNNNFCTCSQVWFSICSHMPCLEFILLTKIVVLLFCRQIVQQKGSNAGLNYLREIIQLSERMGLRLTCDLIGAWCDGSATTEGLQECLELLKVDIWILLYHKGNFMCLYITVLSNILLTNWQHLSKCVTIFRWIWHPAF